MTDTRADDRAVLEMVEQAMQRAGRERAAWLDAHCPAHRRARVEQLLALADHATATGEDSMSALVRTRAAGRAGQRLGAYQLLELIGAGGMGEVYLAERVDGAFDARVAIKIIRASQLGEIGVAQFQRERQILSDLQHPGIANLLDGGATDDGLPYVVMELVDGVPLDTYLAENPLPLDDRIKLFQHICDAVAHAHRALVIHRDIKPSNILVSASGQPKLLDFGIARSLQADDPGLQTVAMVLTPAYASPEQLTGGRLTTATDVYSLGVVLYQVLSTARPYETSNLTPGEFEALVTQRRPEPASERARAQGSPDWQRLRGELDAIVMRALAKEPERRYASVRELRDDLQRYLDGYPVTARGDSLAYRLAKFVRRRKLPVAVAALTTCALVAAYGFTLAQYRAAERERARADARFEQARALAREVLYDVYDKMSGVQGTLPAREQLAQTGMAFLDELATDPRAPEELLLDIGSHYSRLYDLYAGLGVASLGQSEKAFEQLTKAETTLAQLLERSPDNVAAVREMVWVKRLAANHALSYTTDTALAKAQAQAGLDLADAMSARLAEPDWPLESRRWNIRIDLVKSMLWAQETDAALTLLDRYLPELEQPGWRENLRGWERKRVYAYSMRAEANLDAGRPQAAIPDFEVALEYYGQRAAQNPGDAQSNTQLMRIHHSLSNAYVSLQQWDAALGHARAARDVSNAQLALDPMDTQTRRNLALHEQQVGKILSRAGQHELASASLDRALDTLRELAAQDADNRGLVRDQAIALIDAGDVLHVRGQRRGACALYAQSQALWDQLEGSGDVTEYDRTFGLKITRDRLDERCG